MRRFVVQFRARLLNALSFRWLESHERFTRVDQGNRFAIIIEAPEPELAPFRARVACERLLEGEYDFDGFQTIDELATGDPASSTEPVVASDSTTDKPKPKRRRRGK